MHYLQRSSRVQALLSGFWLVLLGVIFQQVLVANWSDNAYLWIALVGFGLYPAGVLFIIAGLLPYSVVRTVVRYIAQGLLWFVGGLGLMLMILGIIIVLAQGNLYNPVWTSPVFLGHVAGALLLSVTLYVVALRGTR